MENYNDLFMKTFEIKKIEYRTPGRDIDEDGNLCSWYVEEDYPDIEGVLFELLQVYEFVSDAEPLTTKLTRYEIKKTLCKGFVELYNKLLEENDDRAIGIKEDIQEIFNDYIGEN